MVYLYYMSCLRYTILLYVMLEIHHSGREPSMYKSSVEVPYSLHEVLTGPDGEQPVLTVGPLGQGSEGTVTPTLTLLHVVPARTSTRGARAAVSVGRAEAVREVGAVEALQLEGGGEDVVGVEGVGQGVPVLLPLHGDVTEAGVDGVGGGRAVVDVVDVEAVLGLT